MARKRRACCEAVKEGEPQKGGEPGASGGGAKRRAAMRVDKASGRAAGDVSEATEPRRRSRTGLLSAPASVARSERQRAEASGIVTGTAKTASAGFVEPGKAKPRPAE